MAGRSRKRGAPLGPCDDHISFRTLSRLVAHTNRGIHRHHIARPFRLGRARPGGHTPYTTRWGGRPRSRSSGVGGRAGASPRAIAVRSRSLPCQSGGLRTVSTPADRASQGWQRRSGQLRFVESPSLAASARRALSSAVVRRRSISSCQHEPPPQHNPEQSAKNARAQQNDARSGSHARANVFFRRSQ